MYKSKFLAVVIAIVTILVTVVPISAETLSTDEWISEVGSIVDGHKNGKVNVVYASDSVLSNGIFVEPSLDVLSKQVLLSITTELPSGYVIYDTPSTDYIDGIRVNGNTVTSYQVPIDYTQDIDYEVVVKIVYAEGFMGTLAQISDGTYNWANLLENPIGLLMAVYYVLATISVCGAIFAMLRGRSKKVKSTEEISKAVADAAHATATTTIEEQILPIVTSFQNTAQSLVKAFALTTSKSKEAPAALLDVLQQVSNTDTAAAISQAKELIENSRKAAEAKHSATLAALNTIANTSQEVNSNEAKPSNESQETPAIF